MARGIPWTHAQRETLVRMIGEGASILAISDAVGRPVAGVKAVLAAMRKAGQMAASDGPGRHQRPAPADFTDMAATMTIAGLAEHYGAHRNSVRRWIEETGVCAATIVERSRRAAVARATERLIEARRAAAARGPVCNIQMATLAFEERFKAWAPKHGAVVHDYRRAS